jgi:hypothetical protein
VTIDIVSNIVVRDLDARRPSWSDGREAVPLVTPMPATRPPLLLVSLLALSCAAPSRPAPPPQQQRSSPAPAPAVPAGFEPVPGERRGELDLDADGKPDAWTYTIRDGRGEEVLVRRERDLDGDGRADTWERFGPDGAVTAAAYDLDLDGAPDELHFFEGDRLVRTELSRGAGGVPRTWAFYEGGKLVRKERDTDGDGRADQWEHWSNGELRRIGVDRDGDGVVDHWELK